MTKGWHHESTRHSLAARGIKTANTGPYYSDPELIKQEVLRQIMFFGGKQDLLTPLTVSADLEDPDNPGTYEVTIDTLSGGQYGSHMPGIIADRLGLKIPKDARDVDGNPTDDWDEYEWAWDEIERKAGKIADALNEVSGLPGHFYASFLEDYGDYDMFYRWEREDHPEFNYEEKPKRKVISDRGEALTAIADSYEVSLSNVHDDGDVDFELKR